MKGGGDAKVKKQQEIKDGKFSLRYREFGMIVRERSKEVDLAERMLEMGPPFLVRKLLVFGSSIVQQSRAGLHPPPSFLLHISFVPSVSFLLSLFPKKNEMTKLC